MLNISIFSPRSVGCGILGNLILQTVVESVRAASDQVAQEDYNGM